jgi:acyl-CoA thioester hydrolase
VSVFAWPVRVYWEDTDGGGIVYYANYLRFLERARTEWLRSLGFSQHALCEEPGVMFAVVSLSVEYRRPAKLDDELVRPAKLDDELVITCEPEVEGAASMRFTQQIYRGGREALAKERLLVEANVRVACLDARTLRPKRLPDFLNQGALVNG